MFVRGGYAGLGNRGRLRHPLVVAELFLDRAHRDVTTDYCERGWRTGLKSGVGFSTQSYIM